MSEPVIRSEKPAGAYVMIGGGVGLMVGSFLPWIKVTAPLVGSVSMSGVDGVGDGWILAGLGAVACLLGVFALRGDRRACVAGMLLGLGAAGLSLVDLADVRDRIDSVKGEELLTANYGPGIILCIAAGAAVFGGAMMALPPADRPMWASFWNGGTQQPVGLVCPVGHENPLGARRCTECRSRSLAPY